MTEKPVQLIPLLCVKCMAPIPAQPDEVAWVCEQCGQGLVLEENPTASSSGGRAIAAACAQDFFFSSAIPQGKPGRPFWVSSGAVTITRREVYKGNENQAAQAFWSTPRLFYIPGWAAKLEEIVSIGVQLLAAPVAMRPGARTSFLPVVILPADMKALAEFMVMSIEAGRRDALKRVDFDLALQPPQLWILP